MLTTQQLQICVVSFLFCFRPCILQSFGHHASDENLKANVDDPQVGFQWDWNNLASWAAKVLALLGTECITQVVPSLFPDFGVFWATEALLF